MNQTEMDTDQIKVLIVDDHEIVRTGLATFLEVVDDFMLVGEAGTGEEAVRLCSELKPDVVLLDMVMPGMDGPTTAAEIRATCPDAKILALTSFPEEDLIQRALQAGALGYLMKNVSASELIRAIRSTSVGQPTLAPEATQALMHLANKPPTPGHDLSPREREVLALLAQGLSNHRIADELSISASTANFHVSNILSKLGVTTRTQAAAIAIQNRLIE